MMAGYCRVRSNSTISLLDSCNETTTPEPSAGHVMPRDRVVSGRSVNFFSGSRPAAAAHLRRRRSARNATRASAGRAVAA